MIRVLASGMRAFTLEASEARMVRATDGVPAIGTPAALEDTSPVSEITLNAEDTVYYDGSAEQVERMDLGMAVSRLPAPPSQAARRVAKIGGFRETTWRTSA